MFSTFDDRKVEQKAQATFPWASSKGWKFVNSNKNKPTPKKQFEEARTVDDKYNKENKYLFPFFYIFHTDFCPSLSSVVVLKANRFILPNMGVHTQQRHLYMTNNERSRTQTQVVINVTENLT